MNNSWIKITKDMARVLDGVRIEDGNGFLLAQKEGYERFFNRLEDSVKNKSHVYIIADNDCELLRQRVADRMSKKAQCEVISYTYSSCDDDFSYSKLIRQNADYNDVLILLSSDGMDKKLLRAADLANDLGMKVVTFSACSSINSLSHKGDINFYVNTKDAWVAESNYMCIFNLILNGFEGKEQKNADIFDEIIIPEQNLQKELSSLTYLGF